MRLLSPDSQISIHSLRMEGDVPSCWRGGGDREISIHSLRMEGDISTHPTLCSRQYFNPLPPHGGRRYITGRVSGKIAFQSTPSAWRETRPHTISVAQYCYFNPLPPHGGRPAKDGGYSADFAFQSTPSAWRETAVGGNGAGQHTISIHSLRMEGDCFVRKIISTRCHFNPLPPHGGRRMDTEKYSRNPRYFNPLPPHGGRPSCNKSCLEKIVFQSTPSAWRETAKLHRKAFFISPILVQSCKKGCKRLHSAPEKMIFFEKREKNSVRNLQHLSVRL